MFRILEQIYMGTASSALGGGSSVNVSPLSITPTTSAQSFVPAAGNAYAPVNVSGVTSAIDSNITAANIVNGVNILGVIGTASASAPKEVASYKIYDNGVAAANDQDVTGMFNDIVSIAGRNILSSYPKGGMEYAFYNSSIKGDVVFSNCTTVGVGSCYRTFYQTNITSINMPVLENSTTNTFTQLAYNCKQLTSVSYDALQATSTNSFYSAFDNSGSENGFSASFKNLINVGADSFNSAFAFSNVTSIDLNSVQRLTGGHSFYGGFENSKMIKDFSLPNLTSMNAYQNSGYFQRAFANSNIERINMPARKSASAYAFSDMCNNCVNLTTFDVGEITLQTPLSQMFQGACQNCHNLVNFNVGFVPSSDGLQAYTPSIFNNAFRNCSSLETLNLASWGMATTGESGGFGTIGNMCCDCINLSSVNMFSRRYGFDSSSGNAFRNCYNLKELELTSLTNALTGHTFINTFANSYITNLSFPSICASEDASFANMLKNVTGCTVHFPASSEATMENYPSVLAGFGGTNTTVLFDLPAVAEANAVTNMYNSGTMGGANFAVTASSNAADAYCVFNITTSYWRANTTATVETPQNIVFYTPNPTRLFYLRFTRPGRLNGGDWGHSSYKFYGSNDNSSWEIVNMITGEEPTPGRSQSTTIGAQVMCNSFYTYYKMEFTEKRPGVQQIWYEGLQHNS